MFLLMYAGALTRMPDSPVDCYCLDGLTLIT